MHRFMVHLDELAGLEMVLARGSSARSCRARGPAVLATIKALAAAVAPRGRSAQARGLSS